MPAVAPYTKSTAIVGIPVNGLLALYPIHMACGEILQPRLIRVRRLGPTLPMGELVDLCPIPHLIHPFLLGPKSDPRLIANRSGSYEACGFRPMPSTQYSPVVDSGGPGTASRRSANRSV